jgi:nucleotide-binding universal stress UspA family protein
VHALIATDGSDVSLDAARRGVALLRPTRVTLLTVADTAVVEDSGAGGFEGNLLTPEEADRARAAILATGGHELDDTVTAIGANPAIVERRLVEGASGQMIVHVADEVDADVVVVGSHGHGWFKRMVIGSTSQYVVNHSNRPVLVVPHVDADDGAGTAASDGPAPTGWGG